MTKAIEIPKMTSQGDKIFRGIIVALACSVILVFLLSMYQLGVGGWQSMSRFGLGFIFGMQWSPDSEIFGTATLIVGTLLTSIFALIIAVPLAIASAVFITEYAPTWLAEPVSYLIELLAAIPSVIYGLWAVFVLVPLVRNLQLKILMSPALQNIEWIGGAPTGYGMLTAVLILSVMVIPYAASVSRDVIRLVPADQREAAYALGATKWEVIQKAVLPYARAGIMGGVILSLGRALGETMAVTMVIGNSASIPNSIFDQGATLASIIANEFAEAGGVHYSSLIGVGFLLFVISVIVNFVARVIIARLTPEGIKV